MTTRPFFSPKLGEIGVTVDDSAPFAWSPGFAFTQKQKNVDALHWAITTADPSLTPLEISSMSRSQLGVRLSAFNLGTRNGDKFYCVESVYQASKVFAEGVGPFPQLYGEVPGEVRKFVRESGGTRLVAFRIGGIEWNLNPTRAFYDWVYCRALHRNQNLVAELAPYNCFTDIAFNPAKSVNCQAYAVSLYLSLKANGAIEEALGSKESFLRYHPLDVVVPLKGNAGRKGKGKAHGMGKGKINQLQLFSSAPEQSEHWPV